MAALGTLAAGLAHELNNPAAAVRRSAAQLHDALAEWRRLTLELHALALAGPSPPAADVLQVAAAARPGEPAALDPLALSRQEGELQDWLETQGVEAAWELAPVLAAQGWGREPLARLGEALPAGALPRIARWLAASGLVETLLGEVAAGAGRLSEVVRAVKAYSFLDQAPIQEVDVHAGLEDTLVILRHKLQDGVSVTRVYAPDLPRLEAYGGELNQVWTNIIDNAVDAMQGGGALTLRTQRQGDQVVVEITDSGPGIAPAVQPRIFEPFFTTKPPGAGTGLGLHIAYNIVARHRGSIRVDSRPGTTTFQVTLPIRLKEDRPGGS
jgi:signal transduction histidine kinase